MNDIIRLNYVSHAIEYFNRFVQRAKVGMVDVKALPQDYAIKIAGVLPCLRQAQPFLLPVGGLMFENSEYDTTSYSSKYAPFADLMRLPFPFTAFEFQYGDQELKEIEGVIALCMDAQKVGHPRQKDGFAICYIICANINGERVWTLLPDIVSIEPRTCELAADEIIEMQKTGNTHSKIGDVIISGTVGKIYKFGGNQIDDIAVRATNAVIEAVATLNCDNMESITLEPNAERNKRRAKKGLPRFNTYHVIQVKMKRLRGKQPNAVGGTHSSPRQHTRRGNIARYTKGPLTGRAIWRPHCVVGSRRRGVVEKEYRLASINKQETCGAPGCPGEPCGFCSRG